jgi:hypothetical protein
MISSLLHLIDAFSTPSRTSSVQRQLFPFSAPTTSRTSSSSGCFLSKPGTSAAAAPPDSFELHVGRALDTLRSDYQTILTENPDFSIYDTAIEFIDPSGVKLHGIRNYKAAFRIVHALVKFIYCPSKSSISHRMCFDKARQNIRIHWNVRVVPREIFGGSRSIGHIDGISVYELDQETGNITQHRIEQLLLNDSPFLPKEGIVARLHQEHMVTVPNYHILRFQAALPTTTTTSTTSLMAWEAKGEATANTREDMAAMYPGMDWEAFQSRNKSRKKFGMKPLTPEEFMELQTQINQMADDAAQQAAAIAEQQRQQQQQQSKRNTNFWDQIMGKIQEDTCETNFDCERPKVCCDFGFTKRCCIGGTPVGKYALQPQLVPIPVEAGYPPGGGYHDPRNY